MEQKSMACTGPERSLKKHHVLKKSLKIEKFWNIIEKSFNFPQRSLKKCFAQRKVRLKAQQYANFLGDHESVVS